MQKQADLPTTFAPQKQRKGPQTLPPIPKKLTGQELVLRLRRWNAVAGIVVRDGRARYGVDFVAKKEFHIEAGADRNEGRVWSRLLEAAYVQLRALEEV